MNKAVGYIRVSTVSQVERYSLSFQQEEIQKYCGYKGHELTKIYDDKGISGAKFEERQGLQNLLKDAEAKKFEVVLFYDLSRLGRSTRDVLRVYESLEKQGITLISIKEGIDTSSPAGKLLRTVLAAMAEFEREAKKEITRDGRIQKAKSGLYPAALNKYGFIKRKGGKVVHNQKEKRVLLRAKDMILEEGLSLEKVCQRLDNEGIPTKKGAKHWTKSTLVKMLRSEALMGKLKYAGVEIKVEPIFSTYEWKQIQDKLSVGRKLSPRRAKNEDAIAWFGGGMLRCGLCGSALSPDSRRNKDGTYKRRYRCNGKRPVHQGKGGKGCTLPQVDGNRLEEIVWDGLMREVKKKSFMKEWKAVVKQGQKSDKKTQRELDNLKNKEAEIVLKQDRLIGLYSDDKFEKSQLDAQYSKLMEERNRIKKDIQEINKSLQKTGLTIREINKFIKDIDNLGAKEKREFVRMIVDAIYVSYDGESFGYGIGTRGELSFPVLKRIFPSMSKPLSFHKRNGGSPWGG